VHGVVADVRLDHDPPRRRVGEQQLHHGPDHLAREAVDRLVGRGDEEVHADVAVLDGIGVTHRILRRVVALEQERRPAVVQAEVGVVAGRVGDRAVLPRHALDVGVLHLPEVRLGMRDPTVQQGGVGLGIDGADREHG
jgi:hypothetical protein